MGFFSVRLHSEVLRCNAVRSLHLEKFMDCTFLDFFSTKVS